LKANFTAGSARIDVADEAIDGALGFDLEEGLNAHLQADGHRTQEGQPTVGSGVTQGWEIAIGIDGRILVEDGATVSVAGRLAEGVIVVDHLSAEVGHLASGVAFIREYESLGNRPNGIRSGCINSGQYSTLSILRHETGKRG
jgi:hypothetical protein